MDDIISFLIDFCEKNKIGIQYISYMNPNDPSVSYEWPRLIILNENWKESFEKPFILAHEIGHVMCGNAFCYYIGNNKAERYNECIANKFAINLLLNYCEQNDLFFESKYKFAETFGIPRKLYYLLEEVKVNE